MADADLYRFELLSLVNKIIQQISNRTRINDRAVANFVIGLHDSSKSLPEFKTILNEARDFSDSLMENLNRLILSLHPKHNACMPYLRNPRTGLILFLFDVPSYFITRYINGQKVYFVRYILELWCNTLITQVAVHRG